MTSENEYRKNILESSTLLIDWIAIAPGDFSVPQIATGVHEQRLMTETLEKLVKIGYIERAGKRRGWYRKKDSELDEMDFINAIAEPVKIWLPFGASDLVELYPGNLIIIAGMKSSGKTAVVLNMIRENDKKWDVAYFNSEMGPEELRKRLDLDKTRSIDMWNFKAYRRANDFHQVVRQGKKSLNIIDFLEVHEEFYAIGSQLKKIHDNLNGAIAVVCIQKNPGVDVGLGGWRSMEVTRFAIALERGRVKITEAKNFKRPDINPNGLFKNFKLLNGIQIEDTPKWLRVVEEKKQDKSEAKA